MAAPGRRAPLLGGDDPGRLRYRHRRALRDVDPHVEPPATEIAIATLLPAHLEVHGAAHRVAAVSHDLHVLRLTAVIERRLPDDTGLPARTAGQRGHED